MSNKRKTPEEIATEYCGTESLFWMHACIIANKAYEEADKHPPEGTWAWAYNLMLQGEKMYIEDMIPGCYFEVDGDRVVDQDGAPKLMDRWWLDNTSWQLYQEESEWKECSQQEAEKYLLDEIVDVQAELDGHWYDVLLGDSKVVWRTYPKGGAERMYYSLDQKWRYKKARSV